jgi:hypothetical protein
MLFNTRPRIVAITAIIVKYARSSGYSEKEKKIKATIIANPANGLTLSKMANRLKLILSSSLLEVSATIITLSYVDIFDVAQTLPSKHFCEGNKNRSRDS